MSEMNPQSAEPDQNPTRYRNKIQIPETQHSTSSSIHHPPLRNAAVPVGNKQPPNSEFNPQSERRCPHRPPKFKIQNSTSVPFQHSKPNIWRLRCLLLHQPRQRPRASRHYPHRSTSLGRVREKPLPSPHLRSRSHPCPAIAGRPAMKKNESKKNFISSHLTEFLESLSFVSSGIDQKPILETPTKKCIEKNGAEYTEPGVKVFSKSEGGATISGFRKQLKASLRDTDHACSDEIV